MHTGHQRCCVHTQHDYMYISVFAQRTLHIWPPAHTRSFRDTQASNDAALPAHVVWKHRCHCQKSLCCDKRLNDALARTFLIESTGQSKAARVPKTGFFWSHPESLKWACSWAALLQTLWPCSTEPRRNLDNCWRKLHVSRFLVSYLVIERKTSSI